MGKVFINETSLTAIGDAIREKTGETALLSPAEMATAIAGISAGGEGLQEIVFNGKVNGLNNGGNLDDFFTRYADYVKFRDIITADSVFYSTKLSVIPFDIVFDTDNIGTNGNAAMFKYARQLVRHGKVENLRGYVGDMYNGCQELKHANIVNPMAGKVYGGFMFYGCYRLRTIPTEALNKIYMDNTVADSYQKYNFTIFNSGFWCCYALDELIGLYPPDIKLDSTGNAFNSAFSNCYHLKDIIFATQEDGTPFTRNWTYQTISLGSIGVGHSGMTSYGFGVDKQVSNDTTYQALKNDPDWWSTLKDYSRYDHDSAVRTINSLPDCSAAISGDGANSNTIAFSKTYGAKTDGGAIETLTEEEIAIATEKGWTVVLA